MSTIKPLRRRAGLAAAAALATAAAGLLLSAPAQALPPGVDPANRIGDLYLDVYSGTVATLGGPQQLTTTVGCPEHYRGSSRVYLVWADGTTDPNRFPAVVYIDDLAGAGLDGQPIDRQGVYASRWVTAAFPKSIFTDHTETATYLVTCDPGDAPDGENYPLAGEGIGSSKYFSIEMDFVWGDGSNPTWSAVEPAAAEYDSSESDINVDIPTLTTPPGPATGLKISVKPGATTLTGPNTREAGTAWQATGTLPNVTVNDDRRDAAAADWTLNGKASAFVSGANQIASTNLGWAPNKVSGQGAAGATVAPNANGGLSTDKELATGQASAAQDVTTTVNALFTLDVPETAPAGAYKSTLTLTLI